MAPGPPPFAAPSHTLHYAAVCVPADCSPHDTCPCTELSARAAWPAFLPGGARPPCPASFSCPFVPATPPAAPIVHSDSLVLGRCSRLPAAPNTPHPPFLAPCRGPAFFDALPSMSNADARPWPTHARTPQAPFRPWPFPPEAAGRRTAHPRPRGPPLPPRTLAAGRPDFIAQADPGTTICVPSDGQAAARVAPPPPGHRPLSSRF